MWVLLTGKEVGLVYLYTQLFPYQKHLQYKWINRDIMLITATRVPMVEHILSLIGDQNYEGMSEV